MQQRIHTGEGAFGRTLRDMVRQNNPLASDADIEDGIAHGNIVEHVHIYQLFPKLGLSLLLPEANLLERNRVVSQRLTELGTGHMHACYMQNNKALDIIFDPLDEVYYRCIRDVISWTVYCDRLTANGN